MEEPRSGAAGVLFDEDEGIWWITGGQGQIHFSTELYYPDQFRFSIYVSLPPTLSYHNFVKVNATHFVLLGGQKATDQVFMFDKSVLDTVKSRFYDSKSNVISR